MNTTFFAKVGANGSVCFNHVLESVVPDWSVSIRNIFIQCFNSSMKVMKVTSIDKELEKEVTTA